MKLVMNTGRPFAVVARELGIQESTLGRWVNRFKADQDAGDGALSETERAELARLHKENSELKMDRAFLKNSGVGDGYGAVKGAVGCGCLPDALAGRFPRPVQGAHGCRVQLGCLG